MKRFNWLIGLLLGCSLLITSATIAEVKLPAVIGDNMVLQQHAKVPIWGTADPGEQITVSLGAQQVATTADNEGRWMVSLNSLDAGGPFEMTIAGNNTLTLRNVLVGEVWVCSGQSNMQWSVKASADAEGEIAAADYPMIRLFSVKRTVAEGPLPDTEGSWGACSSQTVGDFSAVGYFFGGELHKMLDVPVGLIHSSWGGTPAEAWTSRPALESEPDFKPILDRWEQILAEYPQAKQKYEDQLAEWKQAAEAAKAEGKPEPRRPGAPLGPDHPHRASGLYNGMIAPLIPYAIQGVIWYQGESNADRAYQYRKLFPAMIQDWRSAWKHGDFPFLFVQLANWRETKPEPVESDWAELREAQLMTLTLPKTAIAVAIDIGDAADIHPKNKQEVGRRLALAAQSIAYGKEVVYSGPIYASMTTEGNKVRLRFMPHTADGLMAKGDEPLKGFAIAGQDHKFVWADARIDGDTVVVWSDQVPHPVAVRYAWADNPVCNLYNKAGLPASPFRTDDWPGVTVDKH
ncbi:sialate O-acetylesterase [Candidatus Poribacteria bacterium]|nr:sialate O-acetylesterase [Candidatus Poribacteria bacterium]